MFLKQIFIYLKIFRLYFIMIYTQYAFIFMHVRFIGYGLTDDLLILLARKDFNFFLNAIPEFLMKP